MTISSSALGELKCGLSRQTLLAEKDEVVAPRFQRLVVDAYAGEKRVIALPGAGHNSPIEGAALTEFHQALDWLLQ